MGIRSPAAFLLAAVFAMAPVGIPVAEDEPAAVLRDEDVVRMLVAGVSEDEVIRTIRSSTTQFDLSDEMVSELRIAGVPGPVLQAMRDRQREIDGPVEQAEPAIPGSRAANRVVVRIRPDHPPKKGGQARLEFPGLAPPSLAAALELGSSPENRAITGAALYLACLTADHVPNHWRRASPLGRDFFSVPRHRMLVFRPEVEKIPASEKTRKRLEGDTDAELFERIDLAVPDVVEAEVDPGVVHDLSLGIAVEIGGRYYRITSAEIPTPPAGEESAVVLLAELRGRLDDGFGVEIGFPAVGLAISDD